METLASLFNAFCGWIVATLMPLIAAYYAGQSQERNNEIKKALEIAKAQRDIANSPDPSVDDVVAWLRGEAADP